MVGADKLCNKGLAESKPSALEFCPDQTKKGKMIELFI
jgi:hypothetical protein